MTSPRKNLQPSLLSRVCSTSVTKSLQIFIIPRSLESLGRAQSRPQRQSTSYFGSLLCKTSSSHPWLWLLTAFLPLFSKLSSLAFIPSIFIRHLVSRGATQSEMRGARACVVANVITHRLSTHLQYLGTPTKRRFLYVFDWLLITYDSILDKSKALQQR